MRGFAAAVVMVASCALGARARADVWDEGPANDNTSESTVNELIHGAEQAHDLAGQAGNTVADVDWFRFRLPYSASFEVIVDGFAGGVGGPGEAPIVELVEFFEGGFGTLEAIPVTGFGSARRISKSHTKVPVPPSGERDYFVRVRGAACGAACTATSRYRIRFYENTLRAPRFNNTQGQSTVLILQNPTLQVVFVFGYAFGEAGQALGTFETVLSPNAVEAINLATFGGGTLANQAGGIQIMNTAPYGSLTGKAVQLDPATGFVFETPLGSRPY